MRINTVIIGAQKCATTSLGHYLAQHPEVCLPKIASSRAAPHPFDLSPGSTTSEGPIAETADAANYTGQKIVLQKRPLWIYDPKYAENIAAYNPDAKLIAVLRNQADRAFAHWRHNVRKGREARAFTQALAREPRRIARNAYFQQHFSYLDRGYYAAQLDRFAEHFPAESILLFTFDELVREPQATCDRALDFLGLPRQQIDASTRFNENPYELRSQALAWPLYALNFVMTDDSRSLHRLRSRLHGRFNLHRATERPVIDNDLKSQIMARFENENTYLAERWKIEIH